MKITNLRINGNKNPMGFCFDQLVCSWSVTEARDKKQANARIEVSLRDDFKELVYVKEGVGLRQSGETLEISRESDSDNGKIVLMPRTAYFYRVCITGDKGEQAVSETAFFETGKMQEEWQGEWIAASLDTDAHPRFRRPFTIERPVKSARLYVSGVGLFEAYLDGEKLGQEYLTPYLSAYEKAVQIITFPVEGLQEGEHTLEILTGRGWYMGVFGLDLTDKNYGDRMAAIGELHIEYTDEGRAVIATDASWTWEKSEIADSGIYEGEVFDSLQTDQKEYPVEVLHPKSNTPGIENLVKEHRKDRYSLPVLAKETLAVQEVIPTPKGETVLDFGQNFAGWVEFDGNLPKGTRIVLDFGEILQEGCFYNRNYRDAKSQFVYVSDGHARWVRPHFTFFGFRYVRVTGWPKEQRMDSFVGKVVYSDLTRTGFLKTSNEKINRLYENTLWGLKSNFLDIPTDCPQRSERLGWTGDAQVFSPTASYHMDTRAFYHKFIQDLMDEQEFLEGGIPNTFPNIGHKDDVSSVWGDAAAILPQTLYRYYGSLEEMRFSYPLTKGWVDYITRKDKERGEKHLYDFGMGFGDWLALDGATPTSFTGGTDNGYIGSVYYYNSTRILAEMAAALGYQEDEKYYGRLCGQIKDAVLKEYFSDTGRLCIDTQAGYITALKFGVYRDRQKVIDGFLSRIQRDCNQIKCGFVGAPMLCTVLAENGLYELAYDFLLKEDFPSWLYSVNLGATTIWERWNSVLPDGTISDTGMNSLNHYAYGSVMEFMYAWVAGIRPLEPGFAKAVIEPHPDIRLRSVSCRYDSVNGTYGCNWRILEDGQVSVRVEIPFQCEAAVRLPGYEKEEMILPAGVYEYTYLPQQDFRRPYHPGTTLGRLSADGEAMRVLERYVPALAGMAMSKDPEMMAKSLEDFREMTFLPFEPEKLTEAVSKIARIVKE